MLGYVARRPVAVQALDLGDQAGRECSRRAIDRPQQIGLRRAAPHADAGRLARERGCTATHHERLRHEQRRAGRDPLPAERGQSVPHVFERVACLDLRDDGRRRHPVAQKPIPEDQRFRPVEDFPSHPAVTAADQHDRRMSGPVETGRVSRHGKSLAPENKDDVRARRRLGNREILPHGSDQLHETVRWERCAACRWIGHAML